MAASAAASMAALAAAAATITMEQQLQVSAPPSICIQMTADENDQAADPLADQLRSRLQAMDSIGSVAAADSTATATATGKRPSFSATRARSRSVGERQWGRVRAVMAWYTRLRRVKK